MDKKGWISTLWAVVLVGGAAPCLAQNDAIFASSYKLEAERRYEAAAQSIQGLADAGSEFAQLRLGWLAYLQGSFNASVAHYNRLLQGRPNILEARLGLMLPLIAQERWADAAVQAQLVLQQSPWDLTAHIRLLACREGLKQWDLIEAQAVALTAVFPSDVSALIYLARARARLGNVVGARLAYIQVLERSPVNVEALAYLKTPA